MGGAGRRRPGTRCPHPCPDRSAGGPGSTGQQPGNPDRHAGVTPVTRKSGTRTSHLYRWNVSHQLRDAVRILARAWICVIWRCWQEGTADDPAKHTALQQILDQQQAAQAAGTAPQEDR
jgi:hypothetical protein